MGVQQGVYSSTENDQRQSNGSYKRRITFIDTHRLSNLSCTANSLVQLTTLNSTTGKTAFEHRKGLKCHKYIYSNFDLHQPCTLEYENGILYHYLLQVQFLILH